MDHMEEVLAIHEHNRKTNEAVIRTELPRTFICPDCYRDPTECFHLTEADLLHMQVGWL